MATLLIILISFCLIFKSCVECNECPNPTFKLAAKYRQRFKLHGDYRYWVAFGSNGKWAIELVDAKFDNKPQTFKCKEAYWLSVKEVDPKSDDKPLCCVARHAIDQYIGLEKAQTNPFAVLPGEYYTNLPKQASPTTKLKVPDSSHFYWMLAMTDISNQIFFYRWLRVKVTQEIYVDFKTRLLTSDVPFVTLPHIEQNAAVCISSDADDCDTGITTDIVAFQVKCKDYTYIRFGFSADGIFKMSFLRCLRTPKADREVYYYPVPDLFETRPTYNSIGLGWKLGSFCASCPSTSIKMTISEREAKMNKQRLQQSLMIGGRAGISKMMHVDARYTQMWFKEAAETLTSGRATQISAVCNGFYLWYWSVSVGTWGEGNAVIPTQLFYCTDRNTPPICRPRIAGMKSSTAFGRLCNGHDVEADFVKESTDTTKKWQSLHDGRPKPVRLQGQRGEEPQFKVIRATVREGAHEESYGDYMDDGVFIAHKGLFVGDMIYDEEAVYINVDGDDEKDVNYYDDSGFEGTDIWMNAWFIVMIVVTFIGCCTLFIAIASVAIVTLLDTQK